MNFEVEIPLTPELYEVLFGGVRPILVCDLQPGVKVSLDSAMVPAGDYEVIGVERSGELMARLDLQAGTSVVSLKVGWFAPISSMTLGQAIERDGRVHECHVGEVDPCACGLPTWGSARLGPRDE